MPDKSPLTLPTLPNVENIDSSKINLAGYYDKEHPEIANQIDQFMDERNKYINSLEERYKNPNWFKIAAGFAKPQLGGFLASLGSASEAAGEQLELQRAVAPTIAKMRAENSIFGSNLAQKNVQQQLFNEWEKGGSKDLKLAGRIYNLDPSSPAAKAVKSVIENASTQAGTQSTTQQTSSREQEAMGKNPYYIPTDQNLQQNFKARALQQNEIFKKGLLDSGLFSPDQVASMMPNDLKSNYDAITKQQAEKRLTDATTSGQVLANSMTSLSNLREARDLAKAPEMDKLLGIGSGQNAVSALMGYITHNDESSYNKLGAAAAKLAQDDPDAYAKFIILQKALNTNVAQARELVQNPSNQTTSLLQATYPNTAMPQKAIVNLLDLMAAQNMNDARIAALRQSNKYRNVNPNVFESSEEFNNVKRQLEQHKSDIVNNKYYEDRLPSEFYNHDSIFKVPEIKGPKSTSSSQPAATSTTGKPLTLAEVQAELERRKAQKKP